MKTKTESPIEKLKKQVEAFEAEAWYETLTERYGGQKAYEKSVTSAFKELQCIKPFLRSRDSIESGRLKNTIRKA